MAWSSRPREEGDGNFIRRRATAWAFAKNSLVPNSVSDTTQANTASNPAPPTGNGRIKDGLVGEWWFDEGSGSSVLDRSFATTTTDLTLSGDYVWKTDTSLSDRKYLSMSATTAAGYNLNPIEIDAIGNGSSFSIEAWVKPTDANGANPGPGRILSLSKAQDGATATQSFMLGHGTWSSAGYSASNYHFRVRAGDVNDDEVVSHFTGDGTALAQLQHIVTTVSHDGSSTLTLKTYVDGDLKVTTEQPNVSLPAFGAWNSSYTLKVGYDSGLSRVFDGDLYLIAVYNKALTLAEINQNRSEGVVSVTDSYLGGSRLFIVEDDLGATIPYNNTVDITVEASGTRNSAINMTVGASSVSGTYGTHFSIDDTTKRITKNATQQTFTLSTSPDLSADIPITFYIETATGGNVISPLGANIDEFNFSANSNKIVPTSNGFGKYLGSYNYQIPLGNSNIASIGRVELDRTFEEPVSFIVSGAGSTSGTYAIKDSLGVYQSLPGSATVVVSANNIAQAFDVSCAPNTEGVVFPDTDSLDFRVLNVSCASDSSMTINSAASAVTVSSYNPPTTGMPTSSDTGFRVSQGSLVDYTTVLNLNNKGYYVISDDGENPVPPGGLVLSGLVIEGGRILINTSRPVKFVDCLFSGTRRYADASNSYAIQLPSPSQVVNDVNNQVDPEAGYGLELEYCTFSGIYKSCYTYTPFHKMKRCSFNWIVSDYLKFPTNPEYLIEECWFGPHMHMKDNATLNSNDGMYSQDDVDNGVLTNPHSDMTQIRLATIDKITFRGNCFAARCDFFETAAGEPADYVSDHLGGCRLDKHFQIDDDNLTVNSLTLEDNWFLSTGQSWCNNWGSTNSNPDGSWDSFTLTYRNNYIGGYGMRYNNISSRPYAAVAAGNMTKIVEGNKWLGHDTETVRLPQEALDAGTRTQTLGAETLNVNDLINGVDFLKLSKDGLNEGGRTNWLSRATPV